MELSIVRHKDAWYVRAGYKVLARYIDEGMAKLHLEKLKKGNNNEPDRANIKTP